MLACFQTRHTHTQYGQTVIISTWIDRERNEATCHVSLDGHLKVVSAVLPMREVMEPRRCTTYFEGRKNGNWPRLSAVARECRIGNAASIITALGATAMADT